MEKRTDIKLLLRWLEEPSNNYSIEELYTLLNTLRSKKSQSVINSFLEEKWNNSQNNIVEPLVSRDDIFKKISAEITFREQNKGELLKKRIRFVFGIATKAAAILFIPLIVAFFYVTSSNFNDSGMDGNRGALLSNTVVPVIDFYSPPGTRSKILLPDSSEVWLNSNSKISYTHGFGDHERVISLFGEAFFSVSKNEKIPFVVNVNDMNIMVTGTQFNVSAYSPDALVETVLVSGEVHLNYKNKGKDRSVVMKPSQKAVLNRESNTLTVEEIDTKAYDSWKDGKLVFDNLTLVQVVDILERWFNVTIVIKNNKLKSYRFTATLDNRSLDQILMYLSFSSPMNYTFENNVVTLSER